MQRFLNLANPVEAESQTKELQAAAPALGLQLRVSEVTTLDEVERVFTAVASDGKGAIQLSVDPLFGRPRAMVAIAARYAVLGPLALMQFAAWLPDLRAGMAHNA